MESSKILLIAIAFFSFAGLASAGHAENQAIIITGADDGKQITVPEGSTFEVRLEQRGATGYSWEIVHPDQTYVEVLESSNTPLSEAPKAGGPVQKTWRIKALKAGQTELNIYLYRPWEGIEKAAERFHVTIRIQ